MTDCFCHLDLSELWTWEGPGPNTSLGGCRPCLARLPWQQQGAQSWLCLAASSFLALVLPSSNVSRMNTFFFFFGCTAACGSSQTRDGTLAAVPACAGDPQPTVPQGNSAKEKSDSCVNLFFF